VPATDKPATVSTSVASEAVNTSSTAGSRTPSSSRTCAAPRRPAAYAAEMWGHSAKVRAVATRWLAWARDTLV
jgi:hypothetical protein